MTSGSLFWGGKGGVLEGGHDIRVLVLGGARGGPWGDT